MVRPGIETVGPKPYLGTRVVSSPRDRRRSMNSPQDTAGHEAAASEQAAAPSRVVLVGARRDARRLIRRLGQKPWSGLPIVGFVDAGHARSTSLSLRSSRHLALHSQTDPVPVLGGIDRLDELVDRARATHVVMAVSEKRGVPARPHPTQLINSDVSVHWLLVDSGRLDLSTIGDGLTRRHRPRASEIRLWPWLRKSGGDRPWSRWVKRAIDASLAAVGLIALAPLFSIVALAIWLTTGRPIFYRQDRVGQGGRLFRIIKFRSMRCDAERETGPIWASDHDTRCTRIGDWLRHTNIDELPQLINVLRGEMSLVGPRPERPSFVAEFRDTVADYDLRHAVPGGMTGWAQVHGWRGRTSLRKRIQYDLDYIERWSPWLDLRILLMTVQHVFWGKTSWTESKRPGKSAA